VRAQHTLVVSLHALGLYSEGCLPSKVAKNSVEWCCAHAVACGGHMPLTLVTGWCYRIFCVRARNSGQFAIDETAMIANRCNSSGSDEP
jgi:hypothetical protein